MAVGELLGIAPVDDHRTAGDEFVERGQVERRRQLVFVEQLTILAVQDRVVHEVAGRRAAAPR